MTPSHSTDVPVDDSRTQHLATPSTAGQLLRQARLKAGKHLAVLSVTLKVPVRDLEALEGDVLDPGKGPVFYRGLASSMCRHLQIDAAPILALLPRASAPLKPLSRANLSFEQEPSHRISSLLWGRVAPSKVFWGAALMLLLTGALVWLPAPTQWAWLDDISLWWADEALMQEPGLATSNSPDRVPDTVPTAVDASSVTSAPSVPSELTAAAPLSGLNPQVAPLQPTSTSPAAADAVRATAAPEWVFFASGDSWLEVRNAQKAVVWTGVIKAGESTRIQSPLPVSVVVGRAQVVTATFRGQLFDLKPHTLVTVARFEVKE
jgi:cytoskeleton protein RodZ